jgi:hypothetical protein
LETALIGFPAERVIRPVRNMLTIEEGKRYLGIMPVVADKTMRLKLVCFYPGNAGTSVPTHTAMILLFRPETGEPLAVMDGRPRDLLDRADDIGQQTAVSQAAILLPMTTSEVLRDSSTSNSPATVAA